MYILFLMFLKAGADLELGASTPLMEASQEGHLELVRYLLEARADVNATTGERTSRCVAQMWSRCACGFYVVTGIYHTRQKDKWVRCNKHGSRYLYK
jgi:hypothetical protein